MAKGQVNSFTPSNSKKRKGVHCKTKVSKLKKSKLYKKKYRGQGR